MKEVRNVQELSKALKHEVSQVRDLYVYLIKRARRRTDRRSLIRDFKIEVVERVLELLGL